MTLHTTRQLRVIWKKLCLQRKNQLRKLLQMKRRLESATLINVTNLLTVGATGGTLAGYRRNKVDVFISTVRNTVPIFRISGSTSAASTVRRSSRVLETAERNVGRLSACCS